MSIEKNLERIANALEILAGSRPPVSTGQSPEATEAEPSSSPATTKPAKSTGKKSSEDKESKDDSPTVVDVRERLKALQKATDANTARSVLAQFDAKVLKDLSEDVYQNVITAAQKLIDGA